MVKKQDAEEMSNAFTSLEDQVDSNTITKTQAKHIWNHVYGDIPYPQSFGGLSIEESTRLLTEKSTREKKLMQRCKKIETEKIRLGNMLKQYPNRGDAPVWLVREYEYNEGILDLCNDKNTDKNQLRKILEM